MLRFLIRRLLLGALVVWMISVVVFAIFYLDPAGPDAVARRIGGKAATPQILAQIKHRLYLDHSVPQQYWHFAIRLLHGDLGYDYYNSQPVTTIVKQAFPISFWLAAGAAILWVSMGVLTGILSAVRPRTLMDRAFTTMALFFYSFPTFVLGLILLLVLYYQLTIHHAGFFPPGGYTNLTAN